jgi:hypothetical protein
MSSSSSSDFSYDRDLQDSRHGSSGGPPSGPFENLFAEAASMDPPTDLADRMRVISLKARVPEDKTTRLPSQFPAGDWRFLQKMVGIMTNTFSVKLHSLMEFAYRFLRSEKRNMPMWHGPARDFSVQFPYERFWPEACVLYNRLERRNQAYPGKIPREGTKALCRALDYFMRDVHLSPGMINRVVKGSPVL